MTFTQGLILGLLLLLSAACLFTIVIGVAVRVGAKAWFEEKWLSLRKEVPDLSTSEEPKIYSSKKGKGVN